VVTFITAWLGAVLTWEDVIEMLTELHDSTSRKDWARLALLSASGWKFILTLALVITGSPS
jgi:hypothetical protein